MGEDCHSIRTGADMQQDRGRTAVGGSTIRKSDTSTWTMDIMIRHMQSMRPVRVVTKPVRLISNESTLRDGDTHKPRTTTNEETLQDGYSKSVGNWPP